MGKSNNMFETASRIKIRFPSNKGPISLEQLWDVPLRSKDDFNLNAIAKAVNAGLKTASEENFVDDGRSPEQSKQVMALDLVKHVIQTRLDEEADTKDRAVRAQKREQIKTLLAEKQNSALGEKSEKELQRLLAELSD